MRSLVSKLIYLFSIIISFPMSYNRRLDALNRAAKILSNIKMETKHGDLQININNQNEIYATYHTMDREYDTVE